jgi:hypothetical protein
MATIRSSVGQRATNRAADVEVIQNLLNSNIRLIPPTEVLVVDGKVGTKTINAISTFQRSVAGMTSPDGRVDPGGRTLARLNGETTVGPRAARNYHYPAGPQASLIEIARPYIGAKEARSNRMGHDPRMREIFEADWLDNKSGGTDGYAWCCSFVSMCVQKLIRQNAVYAHIKPPRTASVSGFRTRWAPKQNCLIFPPNHQHYWPHKGDVVVYTFSHIGIVDTAGTRSVTTIEGNTNAAGSREGTSVLNKTRGFNVIRCFIRLPIPVSYDVENRVCVA